MDPDGSEDGDMYNLVQKDRISRHRLQTLRYVQVQGDRPFALCKYSIKMMCYVQFI